MITLDRLSERSKRVLRHVVDSKSHTLENDFRSSIIAIVIFAIVGWWS